MPLQSMTGYSRVVTSTETAQYQIEMRSVNSKNLNLISKVSRAYSFLEPIMNQEITEGIKRGKVECTVRIKIVSGDLSTVRINEKTAMDYYYSLEELRRTLNIAESISFETMLSNPDIVSFGLAEEGEELLKKDFSPILKEVISDMIESRLVEGKKLEGVLLESLHEIKNIRDTIKEEAGNLKLYYRERLRENLNEFLGEIDKNYSEERLEFELALLAEKADIKEEIDRIESHYNEMVKIINGCGENDSVGAKLLFFCQELGREFNTIGSKNKLSTISNLVIDGKSTVNSIKEQLYNIQ
ncbi:MAG TPA: YicC family protein [Thermotogota bacterium]|nr:YicC family protein [Thermotogota bacterium]HPJ89071.1 YicC family protein [Thermotogota bacterium]HPR95115.1 YicC family protein [Thermotogota bacterium]